ncbi:MAG: ADP-forming succinate--CoA ligase subunit beta [Candidatus Bipolaricaulota bacterium]|nr:ADP-forming succinate--CoA ligase subunit beta [Candidatus Bipolaricaulota bacterium]MDW8152289.1 ADP-forming succinate--CoA ligase subunit beta [Candidatus Bipolaricaulota bacterium]
MRLLEWQGREVLARVGIPVPPGGLARSPAEAHRIAAELGKPVVLKAQVPVGGRGKAGGVRLAQSPAEAERLAQEMLGSTLKGFRVESLLVLEAVTPRAEHYLGLTLDRSRRMPLFLYSPQGGVEIEEVARQSPHLVSREAVPPLEGPSAFRLRRLFALAPAPLRPALMDLAKKLWQAFLTYEAHLVEINPLAEVDGKLWALDAKVILDDDHSPGPQFEGLSEAGADPLEAEAKAAGMSYVRLDGEIGILGNGAGLVMATLDLVVQAGGRPANFLDIGGGARAERVKKGVEIILKDGRAKVLFVNVFGGITRCDEVARGLVEALQGKDLPVVIRLVGTNEEEGRRILEGAGFVPVRTMEEGAARAVALSKGV